MNVHQGKSTYRTSGAILAAAFALGIVAFSIPQQVRALSFFSWFTSSAEAGAAAIMPDASLDILDPAVNSDPNPHKGQRSLALTEGSALMSEAGPEGTPADIDATPTNGTISVYVVRSGDTLSEIASMFEVSANTILWANNLSSAKDIHPGDTLVILPVSGVQHTVKSGETLASLAKKYGGEAEDIASFNGLDAGTPLVVGKTIIIPGGVLAAPVVTTSRSTTSLKNPYRGGSGAEIIGYYSNPVPGARLTQDVHGWNGIDLGAPTGTSVYASAGGTVIVSRSSGWNGGYGSYVVISHDNGTQTLYAHLNSVAVSAGSAVAKGALIGTVGKTGRVTGSHLHFEVRGAKNPLTICSVGSVCHVD